MTTLTITRAAVILATTMVFSALAQPRPSGHGFNATGAFHMMVTPGAEVEVSTNLQTWTKLNAASRATTFEDASSRQLPWRFYRLRGGSPPNSNVLGYVRITIPAGKMAMLGSPFASPLRLDSLEGRQAAFGIANPAIKISLYANGKATAHTLDTTSGAWTPALRAIRVQEGFAIDNLGRVPLTLKLSGEVRQGQFNTAVFAGSSLLVPPVPEPGPVPQVFGIPGQDGLQLDVFDEQTQKHQTSTFDSLANAWAPKPPDYTPGRSVFLKAPKPLTWTKTFSVKGP